MVTSRLDKVTGGDQDTRYPQVTMVARPMAQMEGMERYTANLRQSLEELGLQVRVSHPHLPVPNGILRAFRLFGWDLRTFFSSYPVRLAYSEGEIWHLTNHMLATVLLFQRFDKPVVVTVHDIISYLLRNDRKLNTYGHPAHRIFDYLAMLGLRRADAFIADSLWTKETLVQTLGIPHKKVHVVHLGVENRVFRPMLPPPAFWEKYGLDQNGSYILYVGDEVPRKNLANLLRAFAMVHRERSDVQLLKVGASKFPGARQRLLTLCQELAIKDQVRFYDHVSEGDLHLFYNAARVFVYPSLFEGFGLPVLEAMACGTPVVCSNTTALAEVAGDAALQVDPADHNAMAEALLRILEDPALAADMARRGTERASRFTWAKTAVMTAKIYEMALGR